MKSAAFLVVASLLTATAAEARMYKWVDEEGNTHYGDSIPMKYRKQEHKELSSRGLTVKERDALPTEAELAEQRREAKVRAEQEKIAKEQARRDRVLLSTYTTERDLIAARDARLDAIDSQLQLSRELIKNTETKLKNTQQLIENTRTQGHVVPESMYHKLEREKLQLANHKGLQKGHQIKRDEVIVQFDGYIKRFRELMAEKQRKREAYEKRKLARERAAKGLPPLEEGKSN